MSYTLLIVESPKKAKTIQSYLGEAWRVQASYGHCFDLPKKDMGFSPPDFTATYVEAGDGKGIAGIRRAAAGAADIYFATDPDREGEAIAAHIALALKLDPRRTKRVRFHEISQPAVQRALAKPEPIDMRLVAAQEVRRLLDRMVGWIVSPKASNLIGAKLSAGRVQSPAVRLTVERERAIAAFVPVNFFDVVLQLETDGLTWTAKWDPRPFLAPGETHCTDARLADDIAKCSPVNVASVTAAPAQRRPPAPFTSSTLLQVASTALKMNPETVMKHAQTLYEAGLITYHRTDNPNISADAAAEIRSWLIQNGYPVPAKLPSWKAKADAQAAHEAIRPADIGVRQTPQIEPEAAKLYELIWLRTVASQMNSAVYDTTVVTLEGTSPGGRPAIFVARGRVLITPGWLALVTVEDDGEDEEDQARLPKIVEGATLTPTRGKAIKKQTRPPPRYTEASLIEDLENLGIGRPSTYANILKIITERDFIRVDKKRQVHAQPLGDLLVTLLQPMQFMAYEFTRGVENFLDKIATGESNQNALLLNMYTVLKSETNKLTAPAPHLIPETLRGTLHTSTPATAEAFPCPTCGNGMLRRIKAPKGYFWGCTNYKRDAPNEGCTHSQPDVKGRPGARPASAPARSARG